MTGAHDIERPSLAGVDAATEPTIVELEQDGIAWITLNRPAVLNAMSQQLMDELLDALTRAAHNPSVRCVAIRGAGRAFCAGGDVADIRSRQEQAEKAESLGALIEQQSRTMLRHQESVTLLRTMPKPTVAVVHGHAVGGGLCLALAADIRLASTDAQLRVGFAQRSLSGDFGISYLLTHAVGAARARELLLLDPVVTGEEAKTLGLVTSVHPPDELAAAAEGTARLLANGPTIAFGRMKDNLAASETRSLGEVMWVEAMNQRVSANTADAKEAGAAFAERRAPTFTGT